MVNQITQLKENPFLLTKFIFINCNSDAVLDVKAAQHNWKTFKMNLKYKWRI